MAVINFLVQNFILINDSILKKPFLFPEVVHFPLVILSDAIGIVFEFLPPLLAHFHFDRMAFEFFKSFYIPLIIVFEVGLNLIKFLFEVHFIFGVCTSTHVLSVLLINKSQSLLKSIANFLRTCLHSHTFNCTPIERILLLQKIGDNGKLWVKILLVHTHHFHNLTSRQYFHIISRLSSVNGVTVGAFRHDELFTDEWCHYSVIELIFVTLTLLNQILLLQLFAQLNPQMGL